MSIKSILVFCSGMSDRHIQLPDERTQWLNEADNCSCCCETQGDQWPEPPSKWKKSKIRRILKNSGNCCVCTFRCLRRYIKKLVEHKWFQQGILFAILINTLSMGIEYHNQVCKIFKLF